MYWLIWALISLVLSVGYVSAAGTTEVQVQKDETERFEQTYNLDPNGTVEVSNISGNIKVNTWESPQVRLVAVKTAENAERLKEFDVVVESTQQSFKVKVKYKRNNDDEYYKYSGRKSVDYELTVPSASVLKRISSVSGDVSIDGSRNETRASSVSGDVVGKNLGGSVRLSSVSGTAEADFASVEPNTTIKLSSVSGKVKAQFPSYIGASVKATTVSGGIDNDFGLKVNKGKYVGASLKGTIGDGSIKVSLTTVSGDINVSQN